jgi:hypothetical protein
MKDVRTQISKTINAGVGSIAVAAARESDLKPSDEVNEPLVEIRRFEI